MNENTNTPEKRFRTIDLENEMDETESYPPYAKPMPNHRSNPSRIRRDSYRNGMQKPLRLQVIDISETFFDSINFHFRVEVKILMWKVLV